MKNLTSKLNILLILVSVFMLCSCMTEEQKRLNDQVKETAKDCPIKVADGVTIETITYKDNVVTYDVKISTPLMTVATLMNQKDQLKKGLFKLINITKDPKVYEELQLCREAKAGLRFDLTDGTSMMSLDFTPEELSDVK